MLDPVRVAAPEDAFERLFELAVVLGDVMDEGLSERGLTRSRAELLWRLHHRGPMTQRQLSQALRCTPRNVTGLLDGLETDRLVARAPHPTDRRATLVTLTHEGTTTLARLQADYQQGANELFAGITATELTAFLTTLDQLLARLHSTR
jgi:DNA-binding MarR family transcriptional regulator